MGSKVYVVGDIHGGYKALKQVLEASDFDYENDKLISLGDLADGWSETHLVIEELKKIKNFVLLRGNHDEWAMQALVTQIYEQFSEYGDDDELMEILEEFYVPSFFKMSGVGRSWYAHGGLGTEYSYKQNPELIVDHLKFLNRAKIYYIDEENRFFSHAGPHPYFTIEETKPSEFFWNREFWHQAWSGKHPGKKWKEVYIGHTPTTFTNSNKDDNTKPLNRYNVWNMDTGACFNGKISMMNIDTKELFQSEKVRKLYPDECGRMSVTYNQQPDI